MKRILIAIVALFPSLLTFAQGTPSVYYTDFEPDTCFTFHSDFDTLKFDLDQDGNGDIVMFANWHSAVGYIAVITTPASDWQWSWCYVGGAALTDTTMLDGNLSWQYSGGQLGMYPERTCFAFRHLTDDGYHYGWAHIYVLSLAKVCVDRMAYCDGVCPLQWGQTEILGVDENTEPSIATIHPNPASSTLTITGESLRRIDITNMLGQRVATHEAEGPQAIIDISTLPTGIYFVGITDENGKRCVKKVVKE